MKTLLTILLTFCLVADCSAPEASRIQPASLVGIVLGITVVVVGGVAIYVIIKCARKLNQQPPRLESSTNQVDWSQSGTMIAVDDHWEYSEPATNAVRFYRAY